MNRRYPLLLAALVVAIGAILLSLPAQAGYPQAVIRGQTVITPLTQQIIAVPVQQGYYSYSGQVAAPQATANQVVNRTESEYLTKREFLDAMRLMLAESRGDTAYVQENNPKEQYLKNLITQRCVTCHSDKNIAWPGTQNVVRFFDENGKWDKAINWDRVLTVSISGKMPKGGPRLTPEEINALVEKASIPAVAPAVPAPPVVDPPAVNY